MSNHFIDEVRSMLDERSQEVARHLEFAKALRDSRADTLVKTTVNGDLLPFDYDIDRSLVKSISATGYLLLYNLVESTMTAALDSVHKQMRSDNLSFHDLTESIQKICLVNFRDAINKNHIDSHGSNTINEALVWLGYDKDKHWNGNVDALKIKKKARAYGFEIAAHDTSITRGGSSLYGVRLKRNELAHGELSFEQCGHDTSVDELIEIHTQSVVYLGAVLDGIENYLESRGYAAA